MTTGTIAGVVRDASGATVDGASITTEPSSATATSAADGTFTLSGVSIGSYAVDAAKGGYVPFTLTNVGVAAGATTNVSLVLQQETGTTGVVAGLVRDAAGNPLSGVVVSVEGAALSATTGADGTFSIAGVAAGPVFLGALAPSSSYLDGETRRAVTVTAGSTASGVAITLSARPSDSAHYMGYEASCKFCHSGTAGDQSSALKTSAHYRSLSSVGADRIINPTLLAPRVVTNPDVGTTYTYNPATMWPTDANDIVDAGVKAAGPDCNPAGPNGPSGSPCPNVEVYICQLSPGAYAMKFGGKPYTCADGNYLGKVNPAPAGTVPLVRIQTVYGGEGDRDEAMAHRPNLGVFKQRYLARLDDVAVASPWNYATAADKDRDSLTLPVQIAQSGTGGPKFTGYHPTEQKFPGESWTQRARTFAHACAGCHNTGMTIAWQMESVAINVNTPRDDGLATMSEAAITAYNYSDQNITCEHCHGPGSEHVAALGGKGKGIINPKYMTADAERQLCGKCHAYDDATNASPAQDYGFEYAWNSDNAAKVGNGDFVAGVYQLGDYIGNWSERTSDEEAFWNPADTGGKLYGQAHRQQYTMLSFATHTNNPYEKVTCTGCHDAHSLYRGTARAASTTGEYAFEGADFRDNVLCLGCHAGFGPFADVTKDDVAAVHIANGGTVTIDGVAMTAPSETEMGAGQNAIAASVGQHMLGEASMVSAIYDPTNDSMPLGRCTSCHMPKVAKSGGYTIGTAADGKEAIVEGDQASHVFDIVWPYQSLARSMGGPTVYSAGYGTVSCTTSSNGVCNKLGYMPNSCSKCHDSARKPSDIVPQLP